MAEMLDLLQGIPLSQKVRSGIILNESLEKYPPNHIRRVGGETANLRESLRWLKYFILARTQYLRSVSLVVRFFLWRL
jgi:hypothetical protein